MNAIARLLKPRSVAVIGASADPGKTAGRPVSYLVKHGFDGAIYPVNPKVDRIGDLPCYPNVAALPAVPDVGIVLLGAERAHLAVRELATRGAAAAIVLASGYTETGEEGARRQQQPVVTGAPQLVHHRLPHLVGTRQRHRAGRRNSWKRQARCASSGPTPSGS